MSVRPEWWRRAGGLGGAGWCGAGTRSRWRLRGAGRRGALALGAALALAAPAGLGRASDAGELRLADVLAEVRQQNPELAAARDRARAAAAVPARVSAYDDPTLSWEAWNIPDSVRVDRADNNIFRLSQKVPFPGKRTLAGDMAARDAEVEGRAADAVELDLETSVKQAYYDLWQAHENRKIAERERDLLQRYVRTADQKYAVGEATQSDVLRAQVELTHATSRVQTEELAIERATAELNALRSRPPRDPLGVPENPGHPALDATVDALTDLAWKNRPEIGAREAAVERDQAGVRLAERSAYPDFEFSVGRFINSGASDGYGAMASVTLPFVYGSKIEAAESEARARLDGAKHDLQRTRDRVASEVEQLYARARTALLQHEIFYTTHIPQAEQALRVTEAAYQSGTVDFLALIDTVRANLAVHLEHVAAQAEFEKTIAELERAVGAAIPHQAARAESAPRARRAGDGGAMRPGAMRDGGMRHE